MIVEGTPDWDKGVVGVEVHDKGTEWTESEMLANTGKKPVKYIADEYGNIRH